MKDLFPGTAARDEFHRWLNVGYGPFTVWQEGKALVTFSSLGKTPSVNYLYRIFPTQDNSISWDSSILFCGVYNTEHGSLYLANLLIFTPMKLITDGGPVGKTNTLMYESYKAAFNYGNRVRSAAIVTILLLGVSLVCAVQFYMMRDKE